MNSKKCSKCEKVRKFILFSPNKKYKDGLNYWCKQCCSDYTSLWRDKNPLTLKQKRKTSTLSKQLRGKHPLKYKNYSLKYSYGISVLEYEKMLLDQDSKCLICKEIETMKYRGKTKYLSVDHDHNSGQIRGLLCDSCNRGIGYLKDSYKICLSAHEYLKKAIYNVQK